MPYTGFSFEKSEKSYAFSEKTGFKLDQHKILVRLKLYSQSPKFSQTNFLNN